MVLATIFVFLIGLTVLILTAKNICLLLKIVEIAEDEQERF